MDFVAPRARRLVGPPTMLVVVVVAAIQVVGTYLGAQDQHDARTLDALAVVLLVAGPGLLLVRRRYPVPALFAIAAVTLTYLVRSYPFGPVVAAMVIALVGAVMAGHRRAAWIAAAMLYVGHFGLRYLLDLRPPATLGQALGVAAWLLVLLVWVEHARTRRERAAEAGRMREEAARRRAGEERLRMARELHDVLAHNISLINVQAGVALHLMDERPEQVRGSLVAIKQASKDALGELRSVLDVLRQADEEAPRAPAPSLARLEDLVSQAQAGGLTIRTEIDGPPRTLPARVDGTAFRIVQEALTNVIRHAGSASAVIRIGYETDAVTVSVEDQGVGIGQVPKSSGGERRTAGHGLDGMRERAAAVGGEVTTGPGSGGGFRVQARLPLDGPR